ncbi:transcription termination/antitermination protein NusG [Nocardioides ginsengisoli]|uniref:Transcription termination/antitermination protein NusG n=1 Tax=Nocardioides ginsengisoli TaxID=363868 RepID=A0ABW3VYV2_9ACTN
MEQHVSEQYDDPAQADEALAEAAHDVADVEDAEDTAAELEAEETYDGDETVDVDGADEIAAIDDDQTVDEMTGEITDATTDATTDEDEADEPAEDVDPLEAFRRELWSKPGDWFVVHTYSGMENRVKQNLENRVHSLNMEDYIYEVVVPEEDVAQIKNGQRKMVKQRRYASYLLVRMELTDESWAAVRHTPSVTGFVGHSHQPVPLTIDEVIHWLKPAFEEAAAEAEAAAATTGGGAVAAPAKKPIEVADFGINDSVLIVDGAFATLHATITEINAEAQRVKALVEIFGRETPVELSFSQIQRV